MKRDQEGDRQLLTNSSFPHSSTQSKSSSSFRRGKHCKKLRWQGFLKGLEKGQKRGIKGKKKAGMIYKATEWEPHCWSVWLCWEVLHGFAGRPPHCSSDKKLNIWVLSEPTLNFTAFEILPISPSPHMHAFPAWKLILLYALAVTRETTPRNDAVITWDHGNFWVWVSVF